MTREWAQFWVAMAVMAVAASATWMAARGLNVGSLGEWVSGIGALAAAAVALWVAHSQGADAKAAEARADRRAERLRRRTDHALASVAMHGLLDAMELAALVRSQVPKVGDHFATVIKAAAALPRLGEAVSRVESIQLGAISDPDILHAVMNARTHVVLVKQKIVGATNATTQQSAVDMLECDKQLEVAKNLLAIYFGDNGSENPKVRSAAEIEQLTAVMVEKLK